MCCEQILHCVVTRLPLVRAEGYVLEPARLLAALTVPPDLIVLVNSNNPTGQHVPHDALAEMLRHVPRTTRVWINEAYVDYVGPDQSLESVAAQSQRRGVQVDVERLRPQRGPCRLPVRPGRTSGGASAIAAAVCGQPASPGRQRQGGTGSPILSTATQRRRAKCAANWPRELRDAGFRR